METTSLEAGAVARADRDILDTSIADESAVSPSTYTPVKYCVVIPTFEERDNVQPLFERLAHVMSGSAWEAIFVDDDSQDGTAKEVLRLTQDHPNVRLIRRFGRRGLSSAAIEGMMATSAPIVAVIDGDMQHDEAILPEMLARIDSGAELALGTRYANAGSIGSWGGGRARISKLAGSVAARFNHNPVSDPMSGFFATRQDLIVELMPRLSIIGFKLLLDILMSSPRKLNVQEVPYGFRPRIAGKSKLDASVSAEYLLLLLEKQVGTWIPARFFLFGLVGAIGLVFHLLLLRFLLFAGAEFVVAQSVGVIITIASNFILNNLLTYRDRRLRGWAILPGLLSFYAVCGLGALTNVGVATFVYANQAGWLAAGVAGAAIGAVWNYAASSFFTWKNR